MASSKMIIASVLCVTAVVGIAATNGMPDGRGNDETTETQESLKAEVTESGEGTDPFGSGESGAVVVSGTSTETKAQDDDASVGRLAEGKARFTPYAADARPIEKWMHEMLDQPVRNLDFPGDTPLSEVLETIQTYFSKTYGEDDKGNFKLRFYADDGELGLEGIDSLEEVIVADVSFEGMSLRNALKLILDQTADERKSPSTLTYVIQNEVMLITTKVKAEESDEMLVTRVYRVGDLLELDYSEGFTAFGGGTPTGGGSGFMSIPASAGQFSEDQGGVQEPIPPTLATLVMEMTSPPCRWLDVDGEGGAVRIVGQTIVVRQTPKGHEEVVRLLNLLYESAVDEQ
jgi:hypothetical protein